MTSVRWKTAFKLLGANVALWLLLELVSLLVLLGLEAGPPDDEHGQDGWLRQVQGGFQSNLYEWDPECLWRLRPSFRGTDTGGRRFWGGEPLSTNRNGMRGPQRVVEKPPGVRRILILGGSHPMGMYVPYPESYGARLEALLSPAPDVQTVSPSKRSAVRWEVLNAAVPGHTSFQAARWLEAYGLAFQPDIVIADVGVNDTLPLSPDFPLPDHAVRYPPAWAGASRSLLQLSAVYRLLRRLLRPSHEPGAQRVSPEEHVKNLDAIALAGQEHGFRVLHLSQFRVDTFGSGRVDCLFEEEDRKARVDLCSLWRGYGAQARRFFADPIHANADGHRLIAAAIHRRLEALSWLKRGYK